MGNALYWNEIFLGSKWRHECLMVKTLKTVSFVSGAKRAHSTTFPLWVHMQTTFFCFYSRRREVKVKGSGWVILREGKTEKNLWHLSQTFPDCSNRKARVHVQTASAFTLEEVHGCRGLFSGSVHPGGGGSPVSLWPLNFGCQFV